MINSIIVAIIFGILNILLGYIAGFIVSHTHVSHVPPECANWNKEYIMEKSLFMTGIMLYVTLKFIL